MAKKKNEEYSDDDQGYGDEPNFDDPKGYVDDVSDDGTCKIFFYIKYDIMPAWPTRRHFT